VGEIGARHPAKMTRKKIQNIRAASLVSIGTLIKLLLGLIIVLFFGHAGY
jgi:hypothetical protein